MSMRPKKSQSIWDILQQTDRMKSRGLAVGEELDARHGNRRMMTLKKPRKKRK